MLIGDYIRSWFKTDDAPEKKVAGEFGWSESLLYSASDWPKYNPDDLLTTKGRKIYRRMMTDEQIKAVVKFKRDAITSRQAYFEYDAEDSAQEERAEIFEKIIDRMPGSISDVLNNVMSAMYTGFSFSEKVHHLIDIDGKSYVGIKRVALKPFDSIYFKVDEYGNITKVVQKWEDREQTLDHSKFIHHVINPDYDAHYGQSDLREAYRAWFSKDMAIRFWNIYLERSAGGFVWAQPKDGVVLQPGSREYAQLQDVISNIQTKSALILPSGIELNVQTPGSNDAYEKAVASHDKAIAKALLVPNLLGITEQGNTGSYSQSQTQLEAFLWTLDAETCRLEDTLNEQLFRELGDLNWGDNNYPWIKFKPVSESMKYQLIRTWKELVQAGAAQHTDTDEAHVRELLEFPEAGEPVNNQPASTSIQPQGTDDTQTAEGPHMEEDEMEDLPDETIIGKDSLKTGRSKPKLVVDNSGAFSRAVKRVDFGVIEKNTDSLLFNTMHRARDEVGMGIDEVKSIIERERVLSTSKVDAVKLPASMRSALKGVAHFALKDSWRMGANHGTKEMEKARGKRFAVDNIEIAKKAADAFLESRAFTLSGDFSANTEKKITTILYNAIKGSWSLKETFDAIDDEVSSALLPQLQTAIRTTIFEAINEARYEVFSDPQLDGFVEALEYSAILDGRTTEICNDLDGHVHPIDDAFWDKYTPPNHFNCRSIIVPITERDKWKESGEADVDPAEGFG